MKLILAAVIALAVTADAGAYVRNRTTRGVAVFWPGSCTFIQPDSRGTADLSSDVVFATVKKSMSNWMNAAAGCSYFQLQYADPAPLDAHLDGKNVVQFTTGVWCHPDDAQDKGNCYSDVATGITSIFYVDHGGSDDGTLIDTDIQLNDINFTFVVEPSTTPARPGTQISDLENTLTHELGHVMGLDHTCANASTLPSEVDQNGNPPPACDALDQLPPAQAAVIEMATMFPVAQAGETSKRMPTADDAAGICAIYPTTKNPMVCKAVDLNDYNGGCSIGGRAPRSVGLVLVILLALAALLTRRHG